MRLLLAALLFALLGAARADDRYEFPAGPDAESQAAFRIGTLLRLNAIIDERASQERIAGMAVCVRRNGEIVLSRAVGTDGRGNAVRRDTLFDVASLTKQLAGIPAALLLMETEEDFRGGALPIRALLSHRSGLPENIAVEELEARGLEGALAAAEPLFPVYARDQYSNAGYMMLALRARQRHGNALEPLVRRHFWEPLGLRHTTWKPDPWLPVAATGFDADGELLVGRPFDPAADWMAQHADAALPLHSGLFSTAEDTALFYEALIAPEPDAPAAERAASALLYGAFTAAPLQGAPGKLRYRNDAGLDTATGWPLAPADSPLGRYVFQTGYTGCIAWADRGEGVVVVILTNATLTDANEDFLRFRDTFIRAIIANTEPLP